MENVRNRLQQVLKEEQLTVNALAGLHGIQQKTLNNQINASTSISVSTILLFLQQFPKLSTEWLLRGKGNMLLEDIDEPETVEQKDTIDALKDTIEAQKIAIRALQEQVALLKGGDITAAKNTANVG